MTKTLSTSRARILRSDMTDAERRLWAILRSRRLQGFKFRREHPVGRFILDFACIEHRLAVEADGGQHADSKYDERRTVSLQKRGWRVLRFWNNDILTNARGIAETIARELETGGPHPPAAAQRAPPSPGQRERG